MAAIWERFFAGNAAARANPPLRPKETAAWSIGVMIDRLIAYRITRAFGCHDHTVRQLSAKRKAGKFKLTHYLLLGYSFQARCLIVSHCYREANSVIRLISARRATAREEEMYWSLR